jgi:hypothetical protein
MNKARCTFFTLVYRSRIYVFGGYTSGKKRSRKIEYLNEERGAWEVIRMRLVDGVETGLVVDAGSTRLDEFLILGGNAAGGASTAVTRYNLATQNVGEVLRCTLVKARIL